MKKALLLCCVLFFAQVGAMQNQLDELSEYYEDQQQITCKSMLVALLKVLGYHLGLSEQYPYNTDFIAAINAHPPCSQRDTLPDNFNSD